MLAGSKFALPKARISLNQRVKKSILVNQKSRRFLNNARGDPIGGLHPVQIYRRSSMPGARHASSPAQSPFAGLLSSAGAGASTHPRGRNDWQQVFCLGLYDRSCETRSAFAIGVCSCSECNVPGVKFPYMLPYPHPHCGFHAFNYSCNLIRPSPKSIAVNFRIYRSPL